MTRRIAFARVMQETNALSPVATTLHDFESAHYLAGDALLAAATTGPELAGFFKKAELAGFISALKPHRRELEAVPILSAWASSGGPLATTCPESSRRGSSRAFARPARSTACTSRCTARWARKAFPIRRAACCASCAPRAAVRRFVISHDLHANLTAARVGGCDALVAYHTNPHRDHARTGKRAGEIVAGMVLGTVDPVMAWRSLPVILGGGKTIDFLAPMRAVFRRMKRAERRGEALAASTFMVHPWNDDPACGWSTAVVTNGDQASAERGSPDELAGDVLGAAPANSRRRSRARARRSRPRAPPSGAASSASSRCPMHRMWSPPARPAIRRTCSARCSKTARAC